jgi:lipoprotein signal peptidase
VIVLGSDQISKVWARNRELAVLNRGGVFSLLPGWGWNVLMVIIIVGFGSWWWKKKQDKFWGMVGAMMLGGGIGNLIDRLIWQGVWDFVKYPGGITGNLADIWLGIAVVRIVANQLISESVNRDKAD